MESMASASLSSRLASNAPPLNGDFATGNVVDGGIGVNVGPSSPDDDDASDEDIVRTVPREWRRHSCQRGEGIGIIDGV